MKTLKIKIVTVPEFKGLLLDRLTFEYKDFGCGPLFNDLLDTGFPVFNTDDLGSFMRALKGRVNMEQVCVDFGDSMFYWLVSGSDAILVKKNI